MTRLGDGVAQSNSLLHVGSAGGGVGEGVRREVTAGWHVVSAGRLLYGLTLRGELHRRLDDGQFAEQLREDERAHGDQHREEHEGRMLEVAIDAKEGQATGVAQRTQHHQTEGEAGKEDAEDGGTLGEEQGEEQASRRVSGVMVTATSNYPSVRMLVCAHTLVQNCSGELMASPTQSTEMPEIIPIVTMSSEKNDAKVASCARSCA